MNDDKPAEAVAPPTSSSILRATLQTARPRQALQKNLFVFAALVFAGDLFKPKLFLMTLLAAVLFGLVSGAIYILNDLRDVEQDREHPTKRLRPIAAGRLPLRLAQVIFVLLSLGALAASFALNKLFGVTVLVYYLLQIAYCFGVKKIVLLDVFTIATGFVLRAVAGAQAIQVWISPWLLLCTLQLALFLGFGKRRQELVLLGAGAGKHRAILDDYSLPFLDQLISLVIGITIVCYSVYCIESETAHRHPHLWITVPIVIYSLCRYLFLVYRRGLGGEPEEALRKDRPMLAALALWLLVILLLFAFDRPRLGMLQMQ